MNWYLPTKIIFGIGKLYDFGNIDIFQNCKNAIVFCDEFIAKTEIIDDFKKIISNDIILFPRGPNPPTINDVVNSINLFASEDIKLVIAIGGGSTIDHAKAFRAYYGQSNIAESIRNGKVIVLQNLKLVAIPTTSGTGSEVTPYATIWDMEEKKKRSVAGPAIFPDIAIVDPELTLTLPKNQTSSTGLDAFSHAIESYWAKNDNEISDHFALIAMQILNNNLVKAVNDGKDIKNRLSVMKASLLAGMAFSQTRTAAAHAISYPITLKLGLPHGWACSLTLAELLKFNAASLIKREKFKNLLNIFGAESINELSEKWKHFYSQAGGKTLKSLNINLNDIEYIASESYTPGRMGNNPVGLTKQNIINILKKS
ncbi:phosphonoacetaldehyde reductase [bacterium]|nr:phosphonoacetaldehyde reductase [bacterium]